MRRAIIFALVTFATLPADALPVLRLVLAGDPRGLAMGGGETFANFDLGAFRLERPALLVDAKQAFFKVRFDSESTVAITGAHAFAGTRGNDLRARATWVQPFSVHEIPLSIALSGRFEDGALRVRSKTDGVIVDLSEHRAATQLALAVRPWRWLRLGFATGLGLGPSFAFEGVLTAGPLDAGFALRTERLRWSLETPKGPRRTFQRPELDYAIDQTRRTGLVTLRLRTRFVEGFAAFDLLQTDDLEIEGALRPFSWLALRGRVEAARWSFDDWASSSDQPVARVELGVRQTRWTVGLDATFGAHELVLRRIDSALATASAWQDIGEITARQLFAIDLDFDLYLRHLYRATFSQWSLGWQRHGERWTVALGAQHLEATNAAGGLVYGSGETEALSGHDPVRPGVLRAIGLTGGVSYRLGYVTCRLSAAQLVPYESSEEKPASTPPAPPNPVPDPTPSPGALLEKATQTFDGGRLWLLEVERRF